MYKLLPILILVALLLGGSSRNFGNTGLVELDNVSRLTRTSKYTSERKVLASNNNTMLRVEIFDLNRNSSLIVKIRQYNRAGLLTQSTHELKDIGVSEIGLGSTDPEIQVDYDIEVVGRVNYSSKLLQMPKDYNYE